MKTGIVLAGVIGSIFLSAGMARGQETPAYKIVQQDGRWQLLRNGEPFYVKGVVGGQAIGLLRQYGANAIRTGASKASLDRAHEAGLVALANLSMRGERDGMNWDDEQAVAAQKERALQAVRELKDHPAVMCWAVGNELDWIPPGVPYNPKLWQRLNDIAAEIHKINSKHPVMTVVGVGSGQGVKFQRMAEQCPDMDLVGINTYADIPEAAEQVRKSWPKPYMVTEWGPSGHWQVRKTPWDAAIEETSTEKARVIYERYTKVIQADPEHCLGSFVFFWGQRQETTHTWYGLFCDGLPTGAINVMTYLWSGTWPQNRAPAILTLEIVGFTDRSRVYLKPGQEYEAKMACYDGDLDPLTFQWDIRPEVVIPKNVYAGRGEKPAVPIPGLIKGDQGAQVRFTTPQTEGPYRICVQIHDGQGHAAYANMPFCVRQTPDQTPGQQ